MRRIFLSLVLFAAAAAVLSVPSAANASPVDGPMSKRDQVLAFSTDVYRVALWGNEVTEIRLVGDGDTDLDLYVYDQFGDLVAVSNGPTDIETIRFVPRRTAVYTIRVVNLGRVYNEYRITVR
jgi:hypothetical protein